MSEWQRDITENGFYWFTWPNVPGVGLAFIERDAPTRSLKLTVVARDRATDTSMGTTNVYVTRHADVRFCGPLVAPNPPGDTDEDR